MRVHLKILRFILLIRKPMLTALLPRLAKINLLKLTRARTRETKFILTKFLVSPVKRLMRRGPGGLARGVTFMTVMF